MNMLILFTQRNVPDKSTATSTGAYNVADVAWPPSPVEPREPVPTIVVIILVEAVILRIL